MIFHEPAKPEPEPDEMLARAMSAVMAAVLRRVADAIERPRD